MAKYLRIENAIKHEPSIQFFHTPGLSSSRGDEDSIGQFGTGAVFALPVFARNNILEDSILCIGTKVIRYGVEKERLVDSTGSRYSHEHIVAYVGQKTKGEKLNISVGFGELDWTELSMGIREVISNGIDGAIKFDGTLSSFKCEVIDDELPGEKTKAKSGTVRFYIPLTPAVMMYTMEISRRFICKQAGYDKNRSILPSDGVNTILYRKGVMVGERDQPSLFNYDLLFELKESREVNWYEAATKCARTLSEKATIEQAKKFIQKIVMREDKRDYFESDFSSWDLDFETNPNWKIAASDLFKNAVVVSNAREAQLVEERGYQIVMPSDTQYAKLLVQANVKSAADVLDEHTLAGKQFFPANENVLAKAKIVWSKLEKIEMTGGKDMPELGTYSDPVERDRGFYRFDNQTVYVQRDHVDDNGVEIHHVLLHEFGHYITGFLDGTLKFQEWFARVAAKLMMVSN